MLLSGVGEGEEMGRCWSKGTKLQLRRMTKARDLVYSMMTIVKHTVLYISKWLRVDLKSSHHKKQKL